MLVSSTVHLAPFFLIFSFSFSSSLKQIHQDDP
jgi:hypothetical protein